MIAAITGRNLSKWKW